MSDACECFGEKSVIEVYPEIIGEGGLLIDGEDCIGDIKMVKERCQVCRRTYLKQMTFPKP